MKFLKLIGADYTEFRQNIEGARHRIKKAAWDMAPVGRCRIVGPNGRVVAFVNGDPGEAVDETQRAADELVSEQQMAIELDVIKRMKNSGHVTAAPHPKNCKCKLWPGKVDTSVDNRDWPKHHHEACPFRLLYARQKGGVVKHVSASAVHDPVIHHAQKPVNTANPKPTLLGRSSGGASKLGNKIDVVPPPDNCPKCKDFTKSKTMDKSQHHPACVHYQKYLALSKAQTEAGVRPDSKKDERPYLYDLRTQKAVRAAEPDEVEEARARLRDESAALCKVDGTMYLVMRLDGTQLEPAEEKAIEATSDTEPPGPIGMTDAEVDAAAAQASHVVE